MKQSKGMEKLVRKIQPDKGNIYTHLTPYLAHDSTFHLHKSNPILKLFQFGFVFLRQINRTQNVLRFIVFPACWMRTFAEIMFLPLYR